MNVTLDCQIHHADSSYATSAGGRAEVLPDGRNVCSEGWGCPGNARTTNNEVNKSYEDCHFGQPDGDPAGNSLLIAFMPPLQVFSDNEFRDREDLVRATESLLQPLIHYLPKKSARIKIPVASRAHFDENAAQLEGYARPLWAVAALLAAPGHSSRRPMLQPWIGGLREGVDASSPEYWGAIGDWDQRMVEAKIVSFALLAAPETFYSPLP